MSDFLTSYPLDVMTWLSLITWLEYRPKKDMGECHQSWAKKFGFPYRNSRFPVCWNHREKHVSVGRSSSVEASGCATAISRLAMWHHIHEDSGYFPMWLIGTPPKFNSSPLTSYHPKGKGSSSKHHFSGSFVVKLWEDKSLAISIPYIAGAFADGGWAVWLGVVSVITWKLEVTNFPLTRISPPKVRVRKISFSEGIGIVRLIIFLKHMKFYLVVNHLFGKFVFLFSNICWRI